MIRTQARQPRSLQRSLVLSLAVAAAGFAGIASAQESLLGSDFRREKERLTENCSSFKKFPGCAQVLFTDHPLHIAVGSIAPQNGFAAGLAFVASLASHSQLPSLGDRVALLIGALALIPAVLMVLLLVQNAAALLFPAWTAIGPDRATGFEATGQRILSFVGTAFALLVAVLPAALVGGVAAIGARALGVAPAWTAAVWAVVGAVMLGAESYVGIRLLGPAWEKLEPAGLR